MIPVPVCCCSPEPVAPWQAVIAIVLLVVIVTFIVWRTNP